MKRGLWLFNYKGRDLAKACENKACQHESRLDYWTSEHKRALAELKERGISLNEYEVTGGARVDLHIDITLKTRLDEALAKAKGHEAEARAYRQWEAVLRVNPTQDVQLDFDDMVYFGIGEKETSHNA